MLREWVSMLRREFAGYGVAKARRDLLAGLTVAAVALPLALAFGVASGADAAAGLITAVVAGVLIGALGGAPYQISGPTGAMSAVLLAVAHQHGREGLWVAGMMAGMIMVGVGVLRLGRLVALIPAPVVTGFTSGIAVVIAVGQLDAVLGVSLSGAEGTLGRLVSVTRGDWQADPHAMAIAGLVAIVMLSWPYVRGAERLPGSLVGLVAATLLAGAAGWDVATIGEIPPRLLLEDRLRLGAFPWELVPLMVMPAISVAALGSIESLLCGAVAGNMTRHRLHNNIELVAQGIGNLVIPLFGGVPATAAIARTSVGIKSCGATRLTSVFHGLLLIVFAFALAPWIGRVPLAALGGVLLVTAWRMNEWRSIRFIFSRRLRHAIVAFVVTLGATVALDLTQAIFIGIGLSAVMFLAQVSALHLERQRVDPSRLPAQPQRGTDASVYYVAGPLFFATARRLLERIEELDPDSATLILSMRGVPMIDATGVEVLRELLDRQRRGGGALLLCSLQPIVEDLLGRAGLLANLGADAVFWSADRAILALGGELPATQTSVEGGSGASTEGRIIQPHAERMSELD